MQVYILYTQDFSKKRRVGNAASRVDEACQQLSVLPHPTLALRSLPHTLSLPFLRSSLAKIF